MAKKTNANLSPDVWTWTGKSVKELGYPAVDAVVISPTFFRRLVRSGKDREREDYQPVSWQVRTSYIIVEGRRKHTAYIMKLMEGDLLSIFGVRLEDNFDGQQLRHNDLHLLYQLLDRAESCQIDTVLPEVISFLEENIATGLFELRPRVEFCTRRFPDGSPWRKPDLTFPGMSNRRVTQWRQLRLNGV